MQEDVLEVEEEQEHLGEDALVAAALGPQIASTTPKYIFQQEDFQGLERYYLFIMENSIPGAFPALHGPLNYQVLSQYTVCKDIKKLKEWIKRLKNPKSKIQLSDIYERAKAKYKAYVSAPVPQPENANPNLPSMYTIFPKPNNSVLSSKTVEFSTHFLIDECLCANSGRDFLTTPLAHHT